MFDKTGTLTRGRFSVTGFIDPSVDTDELLELAAHAECASLHPIAAALREAYVGDIDRTRVSDVREIGGYGVTAVVDGKSVDTSMGLTPIEGLMMGTRAGDLDLGAATYIMDKEHMTTAEFSNLVNKKSGLAGVSGISSDARDIAAAIDEGNHRADLARQMFIYRVKKYIGAYAAAMNGIDILVFTGGIGENDTYIRGEICKGLTYLGIDVDYDLSNKTRGEEKLLSTSKSKVQVCVIPTDEELMIALDTQALVK